MDRALKFFREQPRALLPLFIIESIMRFSYWGIMSIIVLYLSRHLNYSKDDAYSIFGSFATFGFIGSLFGGILADRLSDFRTVMLIGIYILSAGLCLLVVDPKLALLGFSFIASGIGLFTAASANLLGEFYDESDKNRNDGFTIFYVATNIGGLLGPIVYALIMEVLGIRFAFIFSLLLILSGLFFFHTFSRTKRITVNQPNFLKRVGLPAVFSVLITWAIYFFMQNQKVLVFLLVGVFIATTLFVFFVMKGLNKGDKRKVFCVLFMVFVAFFFFSCEFQTNSSFIVFIDRFVNTNIMGVHLQSSMFASLEPGFVVLCSPLLIMFWRFVKNEPHVLFKQGIGLCLQSFAFAMIALLAYLVCVNGKDVSLVPVFFMMMLLGAAEVLIMPSLISSITTLLPKHLKGTFMGILYLSLAYSGYFSGVIAKLTEAPKHQAQIVGFIDAYKNIALLTLIIGFFVFGVGWSLKKVWSNNP